MTELSMDHDCQKFFLRFSCPAKDVSFGAIYPVQTPMMFVV